MKGRDAEGIRDRPSIRGSFPKQPCQLALGQAEAELHPGLVCGYRCGTFLIFWVAVELCVKCFVDYEDGSDWLSVAILWGNWQFTECWHSVHFGHVQWCLIWLEGRVMEESLGFSSHVGVKFCLFELSCCIFLHYILWAMKASQDSSFSLSLLVFFLFFQSNREGHSQTDTLPQLFFLQMSTAVRSGPG